MFNRGRKPKYIYTIEGDVFTSLSDAAVTMEVHRSTITRWCDSPNKPNCFRGPVSGADSTTRQEVAEVAEKYKLTPLEYMLQVMNDENEDRRLRAQMANWAAPYVHPRADKKPGKKEERGEKARAAGKGRFRAAQPPKLRAVK